MLSIAFLGGAASAGTVGPPIHRTIDLARPFAAASAWRLSIDQGPPVADPNYDGEKAPGALRLCLSRNERKPCEVELESLQGSKQKAPAEERIWNDAHYLGQTEIVLPRGPGKPPALLIQAASLQGLNGDQANFTQVFVYRRNSDRFERVYSFQTAHNNNQEVRFMTSGPLAGDIISVEPTGGAPFGFWVTVNAPQADGSYRQRLKFRSATRYADGNPLAVIDSEMANIEQRLGLWRPGQPLPLPARACAKPHLVKMELWCG